MRFFRASNLSEMHALVLILELFCWILQALLWGFGLLLAPLIEMGMFIKVLGLEPILGRNREEGKGWKWGGEGRVWLGELSSGVSVLTEFVNAFWGLSKRTLDYCHLFMDKLQKCHLTCDLEKYLLFDWKESYDLYLQIGLLQLVANILSGNKKNREG